MLTVPGAGPQLTDTSAAPPTVEARIEKAAVEERDALLMAKSLQGAGAPTRDVKFAMDRAAAAATRKLQLRRFASVKGR